MDKIRKWDKDGLLRNAAFTPLHHAISLLADDFPSLQDCNALLAAHHPPVVVDSGLPVRFVSQEYGRLPFQFQYEPRCYLRGEVPTRADNWHDLFNALVWFAFPQTKAAINARHYRALTVSKEVAKPNGRGMVRDVNTLFDESGILIVYSDAKQAELLRQFRWKELFWHQRHQLQSGMGFYLFGHALYEKMLNPYLGLTGHGLLLQVEEDFFSWTEARRIGRTDELLAAYFSDDHHCRDTRELTPVPLLGIPGWCAENGMEAYYDNTAYFRPGRQSRAARTPLSTAPSSVAG